MSSLSRRACFKCGNVGHYAGEHLRLPWLRLAYLDCSETLKSSCRETNTSNVSTNVAQSLPGQHKPRRIRD